MLEEVLGESWREGVKKVFDREVVAGGFRCGRLSRAIGDDCGSASPGMLELADEET